MKISSNSPYRNQQGNKQGKSHSDVSPRSKSDENEEKQLNYFDESEEVNHFLPNMTNVVVRRVRRLVKNREQCERQYKVKSDEIPAPG